MVTQRPASPVQGCRCVIGSNAGWSARAIAPSDGAMTLDGLDGYLTALVVGPPAVLATWPTADWLPWVWGGDGETGPAGAVPPSSFPFASKRQRKTTVVMVLRHLRHLSQQLGE